MPFISSSKAKMHISGAAKPRVKNTIFPFKDEINGIFIPKISSIYFTEPIPLLQYRLLLYAI